MTASSVAPGFRKAGGRVAVGGSDRSGKRGAAGALPVDGSLHAVPVAEVADGLEGGIQFIYLGSLLAILGFAGYIIIRQVLIRRELDESAKVMGERIRAGDATAEEYFEMGSIMLRKKVFTQVGETRRAATLLSDLSDRDLPAPDENRARVVSTIPRRPR